MSCLEWSLVARFPTRCYVARCVGYKLVIERHNRRHWHWYVEADGELLLDSHERRFASAKHAAEAAVLGRLSDAAREFGFALVPLP